MIVTCFRRGPLWLAVPPRYSWVPPPPRGRILLARVKPANHKVLTYAEYRAVPGVFQNIDPHPPLHPANVSYPHTKGGRVHTRRAVRGAGGSIFWKTPAIGLASYSLISLRLQTLGRYQFWPTKESLLEFNEDPDPTLQIGKAKKISSDWILVQFNIFDFNPDLFNLGCSAL